GHFALKFSGGEGGHVRVSHTVAGNFVAVCKQLLYLGGAHVVRLVGELAGDDVVGADQAVTLHDRAGVGVLVGPAVVKGDADDSAVEWSRGVGAESVVVGDDVTDLGQDLVDGHAFGACRSSEGGFE